MVVIGVFCGIGCVVVIELGKFGVKVVVNYSGSEVKVFEVVDEIKGLGMDVIVV